MLGYMLDTNLFNKLIDGEFAIDAFRGKQLIATHVQFDELSATTNKDRRTLLLSAFIEIDPKMLPTSTAVWDDSRYDMAKYSDEDGVYQKMLARLKELDTGKGKKARGLNQSRDVRIAETALKNHLILLTEDKNLRQVAMEFDGNVTSLKELL